MVEPVRDRVAEELEACGFWRRAAARWLAVMDRPGNTAEQLEWLHMRRGFCRKQLITPQQRKYRGVYGQKQITEP